MAKFKRRRKSNNLIIYFGLFLISVAFSIKYLYKENLINNNTVVSKLLNDNLGNYHNKISDANFILKYALNLDLKKEEYVFSTNKEEKEPDTLEVSNEKDELEEKEPLVYIYNTHQEEKYLSETLEPYNIDTNVLLASKMLKEYLEDEGLKVIVEEQSVTNLLHSLNLKYGGSYQVSRIFMENASKENPTLRYFIDLHRDSSKYENTTAEIDGEKYAKILFVVGLDHDNYEPNLALAENLRKKIENYNPNLFRGIMKKSGKGVNGIYNQDFSPKTLLMEVGGQYNNISEVNNTLKVLAPILKEFIEDDMK